jgi:hypothetical protein
MKQIWPNYSYSPATNVLTLTGLNIDRDQLLLVTAADRGRIMYNFADSSVTASAFTSGANTALTLVATTAGLTTTAALVIYYDDQLASTTVTVSSIPAISGTVTIGNLPDATIPKDWETIGDKIGTGLNAAGLSVDVASIPSISGTVTANLPITEAWAGIYDSGNDCIKIELANLNGDTLSPSNPLPIYGTVTIGSALPAGTNLIGVVTIGAGTVTIGAGTAQIGSVTASISGTVPVSISSVTVGNSVTIGSLPAISGTVTANTFALQGTAVTTSNFTSTTASTVLANFNATRQVLTIFNEGAGNLHICAGATCTTIAYQVRLSAGDYYEVPNHQTTITHSAVFATAGTARVTQVS